MQGLSLRQKLDLRGRRAVETQKANETDGIHLRARRNIRVSHEISCASLVSPLKKYVTWYILVPPLVKRMVRGRGRGHTVSDCNRGQSTPSREERVNE